MNKTHYTKIEKQAVKIVTQLQNELLKLGFSPEQFPGMDPSLACYSYEKDPSNGKLSLVGTWLDERANKVGSLLFHAEGNFFVEYDIVRPHPSRKNWFVEAVNAWGNKQEIKAEARLIPIPE